MSAIGKQIVSIEPESTGGAVDALLVLLTASLCCLVSWAKKD